MEKQKINIHTDGACSPNPGHGGWAALIIIPYSEIEIKGSKDNTTSNAMELTAVIKAILYSKKLGFSNLTIHTDSAFIVSNVSRLEKWHDNAWKTIKNKPIKYHKLWNLLFKLTNQLNITFVKVTHKSHSLKDYKFKKYHEIVNILAQQEAQGRKSNDNP